MEQDYLELLTAPEVAAILRIHAKSIWRLVRDSGFPKPIKISPRITRWRRSEVNAFIEKRASNE